MPDNNNTISNQFTGFPIASLIGDPLQSVADVPLKIGPFSVTSKITGSISSHRENTRKTDTSAKYYVEVHAVDQGMPEGLARVLDIINDNIDPVEDNNNEEDKNSEEQKTDNKKP